MLNLELRNSLEQSLVENVFQLSKPDLCRILWIMTINSSPKLKSLMEKTETVLLGGLKDFAVRDVCIVVWAMCAVDFKQTASFWDNIESFLKEDLSRQQNTGPT